MIRNEFCRLSKAYREHADQVGVEGLGKMAAGLSGDWDVMYELSVPEVNHPEAVVTALLIVVNKHGLIQ